MPVMDVLSKSCDENLSVVVMEHAGFANYYFSVQGRSPGEFPASCNRLARAIQGYGASPVSLDVFGVPGESLPQLRQAFGVLTCPVTWLEGRKGHAAPFHGLLARAVVGPKVASIQVDDVTAGVLFEMNGLRYCRLGGIVPPDRNASRKEQTQAVFEFMERALRNANMNFTNVARTWFYNQDMLEWYDVFNAVRTAFFLERGLFDKFVPASTGIGCRNGCGTALTGGLIAVADRDNKAPLIEVLSPLQRPSFEYGSAFSRAVEFSSCGTRRLFISGTASIEPSGKSVHIGNVRAQIQLTLDVVQAILHSRDMDWNDITRSIAYFKHAEDAYSLEACMKERHMPPLPGILAHTDICRDDLLFELEADAITGE